MESALAEAVSREEAAVAAETNMRTLLREARDAEDNLTDALADTRSQACNTERLLGTMKQTHPDAFSVAVAVEASKQATTAALHELVEQVGYMCILLIIYHLVVTLLSLCVRLRKLSESGMPQKEHCGC